MSKYQGVIFDMDGTLTVPFLDFNQIRREIGLPAIGDLAEQILALPEDEQELAWGIIEVHEQEAIRQQELQPGCRELLGRCREGGLKLGVITRNLAVSVDALCNRFDLAFDTVLTREFPHMKPHPAPVLHILHEWDVPATAVLMVGDYRHDIECGQAAGVATCFFRNPGREPGSCEPDYVVDSMQGLGSLVFGDAWLSAGSR